MMKNPTGACAIVSGHISLRLCVVDSMLMVANTKKQAGLSHEAYSVHECTSTNIEPC